MPLNSDLLRLSMKQSPQREKSASSIPTTPLRRKRFSGTMVRFIPSAHMPSSGTRTTIT